MSSGNKNKSSGLRILWIPGGRKSHPKGRFDSTSKKISYTAGQKKSEVWSLGGSKAQTDLLRADPDTSFLDSPSVSGLTPVTCAVGAAAVGAAAATSDTAEKCAEPSASAAAVELNELNPPPNDDASNTFHKTPLTPNSTTSTAPLLSPPNSPDAPLPAPLDKDDDTTMPAAAKSSTAPALVTTTTTAEIIDENRFSVLGKDISNEVDIYDLPSPPRDDLNARNNLVLNTSAGTTATASTAPTSPSTSPKSDAKSSAGSSSPVKNKAQHRNHNNNQGDVNSIESISDNTKIANLDLEWIDDLMLERNGNEVLHKSKHKKKKKRSTAKELDQLDGVPVKSSNSEKPTNEDEKVVKCLYYTLMCCDCTIS